MRVLKAAQMRMVDAVAMEKFNIPGIVLMENAAASCISEIENFNSFTVVCGKGNNAGDGLAIARRLINMGKKVRTYLVFGADYTKDALINYNILKSMDADILGIGDLDALKIDIMLSDCVVDAIFGTGIKGEIFSPASDVIKIINENAKYVLSVDVPSGINSDSGEVCKQTVRADKTVTFAAYKRGLLLYPAAEFTGDVSVADISIPKAAFSFVDDNINTIDDDFAMEIMPKRRANSHKGDYGRILIIGGSCGMSGAVVMAAESAFKAGAGIVTACVPYEIADIIDTISPQTMTYAVDFEKEQDKILDKMKNYDVILFGNGIGREEYVVTLLDAVLSCADVPVVIDADGLYALSVNPEIIKNSKAEIILTPHSYEMARLSKKTVSEVESGRFEAGKEFATEFGVTLVLKGNHSIITAPKGDSWVNIRGNSGMATAGSGDALAGIIASLSAVMQPHLAAVLGVYLHSRAGDYAKESLSEMGMTAMDIISAIPHILPVENI